jgi:uncharacterized protein
MPSRGMEGQTEPASIGDKLFAGMESGDLDAVRECFAPDALVWHNTNNQVDGVEETLRTLAAFTDYWTLKYDDIRRVKIPDGFAQQHTLRGRGPAGDEFEAHIGVFVTLGAAGRIVRIDEYLDPSQLPKYLDSSQLPLG